MTAVLFRNCTLLDTVAGELVGDRHVLVEEGRVKEVSDVPIAAGEAETVEVAGRTLMPGLCDAHVHITAASPDFAALTRWPPSYVTAHAAGIACGMLGRGFTTVRDAGGADWGLAQAIDEGLIEGPRILFSGHALSQTGGHGDMRAKGEEGRDFCPVCVGTLGRLCDGPDEVRRAARDELRKGASQVKIMASGGIASPTDHIENTQFSLAEIAAAVEEAEAARTYVMAHAYTPRAVRRAVECGVRSIEHGNLIDDECAELLARSGTFLVPTMSTYERLYVEGLEAGLPPALHDKVGDVRDAAVEALEIAYRHDVKIVYGTDLLGRMHAHQSLEFALRAEVQEPIEVIRSATSVAAELFGMAGEIGVVAVGARADILVVDGDPTADLGLLQDQGRHLCVIMKDGRFVVNRLA